MFKYIYLLAFLNGIVLCKNNKNKQNPKIHTFFEPAYDNVSQQLADLELWKKSWSEAGWNPVVLNLDDAKRHSSFETLEAMFDSSEYHVNEYNRMCFYRWLAMSASGGGWMSDFDTYPLYSKPGKDGWNLPNDGRFTCHERHVPCLISGSKEEWDRMVDLLISSYKRHRTEFWTDMRALLEISLDDGDNFIQQKGVMLADHFYSLLSKKSNLYDLYPLYEVDPFELSDSCEFTKGRRAIHFSHDACDKLQFCQAGRGVALERWVDTWREYCIPS